MKYITVHCSASKPSVAMGAAEIDALHKAKGWSGIGYHFVLRRDGTIEVGRPITKKGAHVRGFNDDNIGVCLEGGVNDQGRPEQNFTRAQFSALRWKIIELVGIFGILEENIKGHRDWYPDKNGDGKVDSQDWLKDCPCFSVKQWWSSFLETPLSTN